MSLRPNNNNNNNSAHEVISLPYQTIINGIKNSIQVGLIYVQGKNKKSNKKLMTSKIISNQKKNNKK